MKEGWKIYQLGEVVTFDKRFKGIDRTKQKNIVTFNHVSAELLKSLSVEGGEVKLLATGLFDGYTTIEKAGKNLNNGEVITIPTGGNANIKYYKGLFVDSGNILAVSNREDIYLRYVWYYLIYQNEFLESCYKGTSIKHPYMPDIWELEVPIPPLSEQDKIVSFLDAEFAKIDALKANIEQQLQASKDLFQSALKQYLTPQEGWIKGCLGNFLNFRRGYDLTHAEMKEGDVPVAGSSGIIGYHNEATNISPCITVGRSGSVGKLNIYDKCWAHNTTLFVDDFKGNDPYFLAYLIQSLGVGSYSGGSAVPSLNRNYIHPIPTAVPLSKKEQRDIVVILDTLSEKVALLQKNYDQTITLCNDLKQSLLKSIFE